MKRKNLFMFLILSCLLVFTACNSSQEQTSSNNNSASNNEGVQETADNWPDDTITLVVPYDVGGTSDRIARGVSQKLSEELGVPVTVENRVGGSGIVGTKSYLNDPADGNYLLFVSHPHFEGSIIRDGSYSYDDVDMVGVVHSSPIGLWVNANSGFDTAEDFINELKNNPNKYAYGGLAGSYSDVTAPNV